MINHQCHCHQMLWCFVHFGDHFLYIYIVCKYDDYDHIPHKLDKLIFSLFYELKIDGNQGGPSRKDPCKFQMGQLQDQEPRRSRKQCKNWCNPLGKKLTRAQQSKWVWKKENQFWSTWYKLWKTWLREVWAYCHSRLSIY